MLSYLKKIFKKKNKPILSIHYGKRDENGNVDVYINNEKTNLKLHVWDEEDVKKIQEIAKKIQNEYN